MGPCSGIYESPGLKIQTWGRPSAVIDLDVGHPPTGYPSCCSVFSNELKIDASSTQG